jgi:hypothetical protein
MPFHQSGILISNPDLTSFFSGEGLSPPGDFHQHVSAIRRRQEHTQE